MFYSFAVTNVITFEAHVNYYIIFGQTANKVFVKKEYRSGNKVATF